jgi:hypothetical protein
MCKSPAVYGMFPDKFSHLCRCRTAYCTEEVLREHEKSHELETKGVRRSLVTQLARAATRPSPVSHLIELDLDSNSDSSTAPASSQSTSSGAVAADDNDDVPVLNLSCPESPVF